MRGGPARAAGAGVAVPDLRASVHVAQGWWDRAAALAQAAASPLEGPDAGDLVVVGHSGSGVLLPLVAARTSASTVVFLDAVVPAVRGSTMPSPKLRTFAMGQVRGDRLAVWSSWWGPQAMAMVVPDTGERRLIEAEQPRLPLAFFDEPVPVPAKWPDDRVTYVQWSPAYDEDAAAARGRGWTVLHDEGLHLDMVRRPREVADMLLAIATPP